MNYGSGTVDIIACGQPADGRTLTGGIWLLL